MVSREQEKNLRDLLEFNPDTGERTIQTLLPRKPASADYLTGSTTQHANLVFTLGFDPDKPVDKVGDLLREAQKAPGFRERRLAANSSQSRRR
jgi:hypothetical protein